MLRFFRNVVITTLVLLLLFAGTAAFIVFGPMEGPRRALADAALGQLLGREVSFEGTLEIEPGKITRISFSDARLANSDWAKGDALMKIGQAELLISFSDLLDGKFTFDTVKFANTHFDLEIDETGLTNWDFSGTPLPQVDRLLFEKSQIDFADADTGVKVTADLDRLERNLGQEFGGLEVVGNGKLNSEPFNLSAKLKLPGREFLTKSEVPLRFDASLGGLKVDWTGKLSETGITVDGKTQLGSTELKGEIGLDLSKTRPHFSGNIAAVLFDVADLRSLPWVGAPVKHAIVNERAQSKDFPSSPANQGPIIDDRGVGFNLLDDIDLDLNLKIDQIKGARRSASGFAGRILVVDQQLSLDKFMVRFNGGSITVTGSADTKSSPPTIQLKGSADDWRLGSIWKSLGTRVPISGELYATFDVKARGETLQQMARSADGRFALAISRGRIRSSLLALSGLDLSSWLVSRSAAQGYSDLNCFVGRFSLNQGVAHSQALLMDTTDVTLNGKGTINLRDETLNVHVQPTPKRRRLIEIVSPFTINGSLRNPRVTVHGKVVRSVSEYALAPLNVLGALVGLVTDGGTDTKNPCLKGKGTARPSRRRASRPRTPRSH